MARECNEHKKGGGFKSLGVRRGQKHMERRRAGGSGKASEKQGRLRKAVKDAPRYSRRRGGEGQALNAECWTARSTEWQVGGLGLEFTKRCFMIKLAL